MSDNKLKAQLRSDLTDSMKSRNELRSATLRMVLSAITNEEVSGKTARELSDAEVTTVLSREAKKRREAAAAFDAAARPELATRERAELEIIKSYLPTQLSDDALAQVVSTAIAESGAAGMAAMGAVMKLVQPQVAGKAEGGKIAAEVKKQLAQ